MTNADEVKMDAEYLTSSEQYPPMSNLMLRGHMLGMFYEYVGTPWLEAMVNRCTPLLSAFVVERYRVLDPSKLAEVARQQGFHAKLSPFGNDVLLLGRCVDEEDGAPTYVVFWFDCDVSDSCIGFFKTDDPKETVLAAFEEWVRSRAAAWKGDEVEAADGNGKGVASGEAWPIPLESLRGWMSW